VRETRCPMVAHGVRHASCSPCVLCPGYHQRAERVSQHAPYRPIEHGPARSHSQVAPDHIFPTLAPAQALHDGLARPIQGPSQATPRTSPHGVPGQSARGSPVLLRLRCLCFQHTANNDDDAGADADADAGQSQSIRPKQIAVTGVHIPEARLTCTKPFYSVHIPGTLRHFARCFHSPTTSSVPCEKRLQQASACDAGIPDNGWLRCFPPCSPSRSTVQWSCNHPMT
jgi:hypothetical protein